MNLRLKTYFVGVSWFIASLFSSVVNDIISKYVGSSLPSFEVAFFRFLFSTITLVPFIFYYGKQTLKTSNTYIHIIRGTLLFFGMTGWTYGLTVAQVTTGTVVSLSIPLFVLVFALFFLNENIIWQRWVVTIVGFVGIAITLNPSAADFNPEVLIFVISAIAFAMLDIINKKFVVQESMISMLFYSAIVTALLSAGPSILYWQQPTISELVLLFILGCSANLILYFILKAFSLIDATAVAPYRYLELVIATIAAYGVFGELPTKSAVYGALIVVPATLFIIYSEKKIITEQTIN